MPTTSLAPGSGTLSQGNRAESARAGHMTSFSGYSACAQAWALPMHTPHIHWGSDLFLCGAMNSGLTVTTAMLAGVLMGDSLVSVVKLEA